MELRVAADHDHLSRLAADLIAGVIASRLDAAVVVATGNTPMGAYAELTRRREHGALDASRLRVFQLDEYQGIPADDRRSLRGWTVRSFLRPLGVPERNFVRLPGDAPDPADACREYAAAVRAAGGYDLAVLGLGPNGHLGFNEPPSDARAPTRVVDLTEESLESNAAYWGGRDQVPRRALTAGMDLLLAARQTLLMVSGEHKREILARTVRGPATPDVPSSILQRAAKVVVLADRAAWPDGTP